MELLLEMGLTVLTVLKYKRKPSRLKRSITFASSDLAHQYMGVLYHKYHVYSGISIFNHPFFVIIINRTEEGSMYPKVNRLYLNFLLTLALKNKK